MSVSWDIFILCRWLLYLLHLLLNLLGYLLSSWVIHVAEYRKTSKVLSMKDNNWYKYTECLSNFQISRGFMWRIFWITSVLSNYNNDAQAKYVTDHIDLNCSLFERAKPFRKDYLFCQFMPYEIKLCGIWK